MTQLFRTYAKIGIEEPNGRALEHIVETIPRELGTVFDGKIEPVRELLLTTAIESTTLLQTEMHATVLEGAEPWKCMRQACVTLPMKANTLTIPVGEVGSYAPEVAEGAEIPIGVQDYTAVTLTAKKYGIRPMITDEMVADALYPVMEMEIRKAGAKLENTLNKIALGALIDGTAANEHDTGASAQGIKAIATAVKKVKADGFIPDRVIPTTHLDPGDVLLHPALRLFYALPVHLIRGARKENKPPLRRRVVARQGEAPEHGTPDEGDDLCRLVLPGQHLLGLLLLPHQAGEEPLRLLRARADLLADGVSNGADAAAAQGVDDLARVHDHLTDARLADLACAEEHAEPPDNLVVQPVVGIFDALALILPGAVVKNESVVRLIHQGAQGTGCIIRIETPFLRGWQDADRVDRFPVDALQVPGQDRRAPGAGPAAKTGDDDKCIDIVRPPRVDRVDDRVNLIGSHSCTGYVIGPDTVAFDHRLPDQEPVL